MAGGDYFLENFAPRGGRFYGGEDLLLHRFDLEVEVKEKKSPLLLCLLLKIEYSYYSLCY